MCFSVKKKTKKPQPCLPKDCTIPETASNVMRKTVTTAKNGTKESLAAAAAMILTNSGLNVPEQDGRTNFYEPN